MTWPGGKNGAGVYQRIINHMPPHETYIEPFLGSGAILRNKRPAARNIAIDRSQGAIDLCISRHPQPNDVTFYTENTLEVLSDLGSYFHQKHFVDDPQTLIYLDPPYLPETRKGGDLYDFEMTAGDHHKLLELVYSRPCMAMISGYRSTMYDEFLATWHRIDYRTMTRRGMVDEALWMNFKPPKELHDYTFLGSDYRERERIKRKKQRWQNRISAMDRLERLAIMEVLQNV